RQTNFGTLIDFMLPSDLKPEHFSAYPPLARKLVLEALSSLQTLPLSFLPSLLREVIDYDYKFPAERRAIEKEIQNLPSLSSARHGEWSAGLRQINLPSDLKKFDWVNQPAQFVEQLPSPLWTTHQQDAFRKPPPDYGNRLHAAVPPEKPAIPRVG